MLHIEAYSLLSTPIKAARRPSMATDKLRKIRRGIDNRLGNRTQARPGALHVAGDHQKVGRVARQPVNRRSDDNIAGGKRTISFLSCGRSAVVPVTFSRNTFPHPAAFNSASWLPRSWAPVETRAQA
jgi:hypothetical protein